MGAGGEECGSCYTPAMRALRVSLFLAGLLCVLPSSVSHAQEHRATRASHPSTRDNTIADRVNAILDEPALAHANIGISVTTLDGQTLYAHDDGKLFTPASNAKMLTTAAMYGLLPVDKLKWSTHVVASGTIDAAGTLHGDLVILGAGDPTFGPRKYPYEPPPATPPPPGTPPPPPPDAMQPLNLLAEQVVQSGVRSIEGNVVGDDSFFIDEPWGTSWAWDDLQWGYGAPISALTLNDNEIELTLSAVPNSEKAGATEAMWNPNVDYYVLENDMTMAPAGQEAQPGIQRFPGSRLVRAYGTAPPNGVHAPMAMDDPAEYTATAFMRALKARGITVEGTATSAHRYSVDTGSFEAERELPVSPPLVRADLESVAAPLQGRKILATRTSVPAAEDIMWTNKTSQNLHAELYLRLLGEVFGTEGSLAEGARVVRQFMVNAGVDDNDFFFYDGSGMSMDDRIAPRALTKLLTYAAHQPWGAEWRATLPIAGVDGTLEYRFKDSPLKGKMWAKTGTLNESFALSGYMEAASGKAIAFSILVNNRRPGSPAEHKAMDRIAEAIAESE